MQLGGSFSPFETVRTSPSATHRQRSRPAPAATFGIYVVKLVE
jgi:hypothetical protein